jgi:hypothetical protein
MNKRTIGLLAGLALIVIPLFSTWAVTSLATYYKNHGYSIPNEAGPYVLVQGDERGVLLIDAASITRTGTRVQIAQYYITYIPIPWTSNRVGPPKQSVNAQQSRSDIEFDCQRKMRRQTNLTVWDENNKKINSGKTGDIWLAVNKDDGTGVEIMKMACVGDLIHSRFPVVNKSLDDLRNDYYATPSKYVTENSWRFNPDLASKNAEAWAKEKRVQAQIDLAKAEADVALARAKLAADVARAEREKEASK